MIHAHHYDHHTTLHWNVQNNIPYNMKILLILLLHMYIVCMYIVSTGQQLVNPSDPQFAGNLPPNV